MLILSWPQKTATRLFGDAQQMANPRSLFRTSFLESGSLLSSEFFEVGTFTAVAEGISHIRAGLIMRDQVQS